MNGACHTEDLLKDLYVMFPENPSCPLIPIVIYKMRIHFNGINKGEIITLTSSFRLKNDFPAHIAFRGSEIIRIINQTTRRRVYFGLLYEILEISLPFGKFKYLLRKQQ